MSAPACEDAPRGIERCACLHRRRCLAAMHRETTNANTVVRDYWSSVSSSQLHLARWPSEPDVRRRYENGEQCGGCAFFAPFNYDWGLCYAYDVAIVDYH